MKNYSYIINARIFPAIICTLPILILYYFFLSIYISNFLVFISGMKWIQDISFSAVVIYLLAQVNRVLAKDFFEKKYFSNELDMPTTIFLTHENKQYSRNYKQKIYQKIWNDFHMHLSTITEEARNFIDAKQKIVEAVSLIRKKVGNGTLLLQHNTEYGFMRNLVGGSVISVLISILNIFIFGLIHFNQIALFASVFCLIIFIIPIILSKILMQNYGEHYAKILIQEYMSL